MFTFIRSHERSTNADVARIVALFAALTILAAPSAATSIALNTATCVVNPGNGTCSDSLVSINGNNVANGIEASASTLTSSLVAGVNEIQVTLIGGGSGTFLLQNVAFSWAYVLTDNSGGTLNRSGYSA
jgi:hypothetical protein